MSNFRNKGMSKAEKQSMKRLSDYIATGLDMEDKCIGTTYKNYLQRDKWPAHLPEDDFKNIRECLTIMIEESNKHKEMILTLKRMLKEQ
jgi:hypothetical protein